LRKKRYTPVVFFIQRQDDKKKKNVSPALSGDRGSPEYAAEKEVNTCDATV
jgi:hypothetical protein